jgi:hypothetical protein
MTTTAIDTTAKLVHSYLYSLSEETKIKKLREDYRNSLRDIIMTNDPDDKGNYNYYFDSPLCIDDVWYTGLQMQRRASSYLDEDKAWEVIKAKKLYDRCVKQILVEEIDLDELYAANQEGIISDDEIDSLIQTDESYSLVRIKG